MRKPLEKLSTFVAFGALALALLACKKGEGGACNKNKDCKDNLVCSDDMKCATVEAANKVCEGKEFCKQLGMCSVMSVEADGTGNCAAMSEDDCKKGPCKDGTGKCRVQNHTCVE